MPARHRHHHSSEQRSSRSRWNRVHVPLESAFTMRLKPWPRTTGICTNGHWMAIPATGVLGSLFSAWKIQDLFSKMPAKC